MSGAEHSPPCEHPYLPLSPSSGGPGSKAVVGAEHQEVSAQNLQPACALPSTRIPTDPPTAQLPDLAAILQYTI